MFSGQIDTYIIISEVNRIYFTGMYADRGCAIISKDVKVMLTDFTYHSVASKQLEGWKVVGYNGNIYSAIAKQLEKLGTKVAGYEEKSISIAEYNQLSESCQNIKFIAASDILNEKRLIKTDEQVRNVANAQIIAQKALTNVVKRIKLGMSERELAADLDYEMRILGSERPAFETVVSFGKNCSEPHHIANDTKLEKNDLIMVNMGARLRGYCSDMTRTFTLGESDERLANIHEIVLGAQNYALEHIKAGMTCQEADAYAREYILANGYGVEFGHALGHGVGVEINEAPSVANGCKVSLRPNMVITCEPGVYVEGLGGVRIGDILVVTEEGVVNLTNFDKNINLKL